MRTKYTFNTDWQFTKPGEPPQVVALPHTWNAKDGTDGGNDYFRGTCTYTKEFAAPVHTDGEGGCVHVHATIANHDLASGTAIAHGTDHATVKRKNDRLSREMGFTVVGPEPAREPTTWAERKGQFGIESFERVLGNLA